MADDRKLLIESPLGVECTAVRLSGEERINDLYSFSVTVANPKPVDPEDILGAEVTITLRQTEEKVRPVFGIVARIDQIDPIGDNRFEYNLEVVPPLWLLSLSAHTRLFTEKTTLEIVQTVMSDAGLTMPIETNINAFKPRETCAQYNETDLEFVMRLLAEDGICFFFKHVDGNVTMSMIDAVTGFPKCQPHSYEYRGRRSSESLLCVSDFRRSSRLASASLENFDYSEYSAPNHRSFSADSKGPSTIRRGNVQRHAGQYFERKGNGRNLDTGDSNKRTSAVLDGLEADAEYYTCESSWPTMVAGHRMKLDPKPAVADETEFIVLEALHEAAEGVEVDSFYSNFLRCAPMSNKVAFRPPPPSPTPRIWGAQTAVVVEVRPIPADGVHAEVKVRFPWHAEGFSCWARVAQLYAGNKWGGYFVPELEQEVLVEFIGGDIYRPVVVGAVYNSHNPIPPYNNWQSGIRTRSSNYNELLFTDEPDAEVFYTEAGKDYTFLVHNNQTGTVENNRSVEIYHDDSLTVGNDRTVTVKKNYDITVEEGDYSCTVQKGDYTTEISAGKQSVTAKQEIKLKVGGSSITMKPSSIELKIGGSSITMEGSEIKINSVNVTVAGSGMTKVTGGGMVQIQGGIVKIN